MLNNAQMVKPLDANLLFVGMNSINTVWTLDLWFVSSVHATCF